jgi:hypothetical protein
VGFDENKQCNPNLGIKPRLVEAADVAVFNTNNFPMQCKFTRFVQCGRRTPPLVEAQSGPLL